MQDLSLGGSVTVVEAGPTLLGSSPAGARRLLTGYLESRGVEVLLGWSILSYEGGVATAEDGRRVEADLIVAATGVAPPGVFGHSRLATGADGGLWFDHHLRGPSDGRTFGGGDSASFRGRGLPRLGVFAIRQGPVLCHNLQAVLRGRPLKGRGRLAATLKHRID